MKIKKGVEFKIEHNKSLFYVIIILLILFILLIVFIINQNYSVEGDLENECTFDSDCIPKICCHASTCTSKNQAPDCSNLLCTMECAPGTLDCGQGECKCVNNQCKTIFTN